MRKAMADYFAGQRFFDFYTEQPDEDEVEREKARATPRSAARASIAVIRCANRELPEQTPEESPPDVELHDEPAGPTTRPLARFRSTVPCDGP